MTFKRKLGNSAKATLATLVGLGTLLNCNAIDETNKPIKPRSGPVEVINTPTPTTATFNTLLPESKVKTHFYRSYTPDYSDYVWIDVKMPEDYEFNGHEDANEYLELSDGQRAQLIINSKEAFYRFDINRVTSRVPISKVDSLNPDQKGLYDMLKIKPDEAQKILDNW